MTAPTTMIGRPAGGLAQPTRTEAPDLVAALFYANPDGGEGDWAALITPLRASNGDLAQAWDAETAVEVEAA